MLRSGHTLTIESAQDAVDLVTLLLRRERPTSEILKALDEHEALFPPGFDRVRAAVAKGNLGGAQSAMQVALSPDDRR